MLIDDTLFDELAERAKQSERLRMNFNLHESAESKAQRLFNALEPGTVLPIHRHRATAETFIILRGKLDVMFFNDQGEETERHRLDVSRGHYGIQIPKGQWHSLEVVEPAVIFEVKDGPYRPLDPCDAMPSVPDWSIPSNITFKERKSGRRRMEQKVFSGRTAISNMKIVSCVRFE